MVLDPVGPPVASSTVLRPRAFGPDSWAGMFGPLSPFWYGRQELVSTEKGAS